MQAAATQTARVEEVTGAEATADATTGTPSSTPAVEPDPAQAAPSSWSRLVDRIRANEDAALEELYRIFSKGIRYYLCRQLGTQELDDKVHDTFLIVVQAIQRQELRDPERLMGFVRTVVRRQVAAYIGTAVQSRRDYVDLDAGASVVDAQRNPEETAMARETIDIMKTVLSSISARDREILTRFYLLEQSQERICADMQLSETQFRLLKSRAKARFGELGKRRVVRGSPGSFFQRISALGRH
ncbi:MAG: sigma-70 family RNA polymerase sigma factor [Acidobacteria bacterium]|nr:sigma-70 family RNA polymerase sigma factor [Acidobacteriota bacterium]